MDRYMIVLSSDMAYIIGKEYLYVVAQSKKEAKAIAIKQYDLTELDIHKIFKIP